MSKRVESVDLINFDVMMILLYQITATRKEELDLITAVRVKNIHAITRIFDKYNINVNCRDSDVSNHSNKNNPMALLNNFRW
jgi:hypothetical protein